jgi:hypothetical protein
MLHTGRRRGGLRTTAGEDDPTVTPPATIVKHFRCGPSIIARERLAARAVKAASRVVARAERSRANAERLERARCELHNDRATAEDRDVDLHAFDAAWRSKMVVAHATVLRLTTSPAVSHLSGGTRRRPMRPFGNSQH